MTLVWRPGYTTTFADPDVQAYLTAVEEADNQALEYPVAVAIDEFVRGCKADGIWNAIKASCILAGARTRLGALTPLVGTAPTSFNFVDGDYNRKTGLVGDGSTKYLDSNRNNSPNSGGDPKDNVSLGVYLSTGPTSNGASFIGTAGGGTAAGSELHIGRITSTSVFSRLRNASRTDTDVSSNFTGFFGISRSNSSAYLIRARGAGATITQASSGAYSSLNYFVFGRNQAGSLEGPINARLAFYSIGESLDLALLDARVTALINRFAAVIP